MFKALHHFNVIVSDIERTKQFYNQTLGLGMAVETAIENVEFSRGVGVTNWEKSSGQSLRLGARLKFW